MSTEELVRANLRVADRQQQRESREVLKRMLQTGRILQEDLGLVATPSPNRRKSLTLLSVSDLISMGLVVVVPPAGAAGAVA